MFRGYHSFPNAGTAYAPQCRKMPNFASRNQSGTVYADSDSQVSSYGPAAMTACTRASSATSSSGSSRAGQVVGASG